MREIGNIAAEGRGRLGKGGARTLRRAGRVPAIVYGGEEAPMPVSLNLREITREVQKPGFFTRLFDLKLDGESIRVLPRDVQFDPVTDSPEHVDFQRYVAGQKVHIGVPVHFTSEDKSPGIKRGGVLNIVRHEIELIGEIEKIPERIVISVEGLEIGDSVHMSTVALPAGVGPAIADRDFTIATVAAPTVVRVEAEEAAAAAAAEAAEVVPTEGEAAKAEGEPEAKGKAEGKGKAETKPGEGKAGD